MANKRNRKAIHIKPDRSQKVRPHDLTEEKAKKLLLRKIQEAQKIVDNVEKTADTYVKVFTNMTAEFNCRQFQRIKADFESIKDHVIDLKTNGPTTADKEIPLSESEISDEEQAHLTPGLKVVE